jgi:hypothetical protein
LISKYNKDKINRIKTNIYKNLTEDYQREDNSLNIALFHKDNGNVIYGHVTLDQIMSKIEEGLIKEFSK